MSILLIDIDDFKLVNDTYGHQIGDQVLIKLTSTCQRIVRSSDIVSRFGGEEFLIVFPEANQESALIIANKLRIVIESLIFESSGLSISISGGICEVANHSLDEAIKIADENLYIAKASGKNCIVGSS